MTIIMLTNDRAVDENGFPKPKKVKCFKCKEWFWLKFVVPQQNYSLKNNWGYWTSKDIDNNKSVCNLCLRNFYLNERKMFLSTIKDLKKRNNLRTYVSHNVI